MKILSCLLLNLLTLLSAWGAGRVGPGHIRFSTDSHRTRFSTESTRDDLRGSNLGVQIVEFTCGGYPHNETNDFAIETIEDETYHNTLFGVHVTMPSGYRFLDDQGSWSAEDCELVGMAGESEVALLAEPRLSRLQIEEDMKEAGLAICSRVSRSFRGVEGDFYILEVEGIEILVFVFSDRHMTYSLFSILEDREVDLLRFEEIAGNIVLD